MRTIAYNQNGFTLVELVIAMALTVILLSAVVSLLATSLKAWQTDSRKVEIQQTARIGLDAISRELKYAQSITLDADKHGVTVEKKKTTGDTQSIHIYSDAAGVLRRENVTDGGGAQPLTGGNNVKITATFAMDSYNGKTDKRTVSVTLDAIDTFTDKLPRQKTTILTKIVSLNVP